MMFAERQKYRKLSGIYQIRNIVNEKVYIGQTKQPFLKRFLHHVWKLRKGNHDNKHLQRAFDLYTEEAFVFEVLEVVEDSKLLDEKEIEYIEKAKRCNLCYNISDGGQGLHGVPMPSHVKEMLSELNRKLNTGKRLSVETRKKMSDSRKGTKRSNDEVSKMLQTRTNKILSGNKTKSCKITVEEVKQIKQMLMEGFAYEHIANQFSISSSNVNAIRSNRSWKYVQVEGWDEYLKTIKRTIRKRKPTLCQASLEEGATTIPQGST